MSFDASGRAQRPRSGVVKSADRVLDVLELCGEWGAELTHADMASELGIPKSSLTPLLRNLTAREFIEYNPLTKGYRIGPAVARLAHRPWHERTLMGIIEPLAESLTAATLESVTVTRLLGRVVETIVSFTSPQRLVSHMRVGDRAPLYATSGGKAMLAYLPADEVNAYLDGLQFESITPSTISNADALLAELDEIRRTGFSYVHEEFTLGVGAVGTAVLAADGSPVAGLSVIIPLVRMSEESRALAETELMKARSQAMRLLNTEVSER